jgi:hypothetical protein
MLYRILQKSELQCRSLREHASFEHTAASSPVCLQASIGQTSASNGRADLYEVADTAELRHQIDNGVGRAVEFSNWFHAHDP